MLGIRADLLLLALAADSRIFWTAGTSKPIKITPVVSPSQGSQAEGGVVLPVSSGMSQW